jgi:hypothetical protein
MYVLTLIAYLLTAGVHCICRSLMQSAECVTQRNRTVCWWCDHDGFV